VLTINREIQKTMKNLKAKKTMKAAWTKLESWKIHQLVQVFKVCVEMGKFLG